MRYLFETGSSPVRIDSIQTDARDSADCAADRSCCEATDFHVHAGYDLGITPGLLSGHFAIVASSILRCWATNAGGVCVSQLDREISS
jgi:hypothetical protein